MSFPNTVVKFLKPDLAIYHSSWEMSGITSSGGSALPPKHGILTAIAQQQNGVWLIIAVHNTETIALPQP
jgi:ketosteroid isomerase-like protein